MSVLYGIPVNVSDIGELPFLRAAEQLHVELAAGVLRDRALVNFGGPVILLLYHFGHDESIKSVQKQVVPLTDDKTKEFHRMKYPTHTR